MKRSLKKILILSIWEDIWSLGEGCGVADELEFIRHVTREGIELHFLIPEPRPKRDIVPDPLLAYYTYPNVFRAFRRFPAIMRRFLWPMFFPLAAYGRLERLARAIQPDVILGFTHYAFYPLNRIGRRLGVPTVVKLFGVMYLDRFDFPRIKYLWKSMEQIIALRRIVDHYIILNDGTRGEMALTRLGVPPEKISFLPNGMDVEWADVNVDRGEARKSMSLPSDDVLLVTFSRLVKSKRIELFLRAAAMMDPLLLKRVTVVIGGDGPERARLEREARALGLERKVIFTGAIPHRDVVRFLKASDVFAATNELTNMSLPPCEAILCGVPVVAFDVSGTSEVVRDGETGLLVPNGDVAALAAALERIVRDEALRKRLGAQALAFARAHFVSWGQRIAMELDVLERMASRV
ncbi:MAG: glycosyltransferase family 4 protein [Candidatus Krumholzibacteria bacterium]|nr:glycosyltransferase family 4 protein [Candidatus Krumholzibacteria bacterium]